jgi:hypothetical protein
VKRVLTAVALVVLLAAIAVSTALARGGKGSQTLSATCTANGAVTVHASSGQSAWVNNTHWVVLRFTGTFTPTGGTAQTFTKVYGHKTGLMKRTIDTCSGSQSDSSGSFVFTATVAKTTR